MSTQPVTVPEKRVIFSMAGKGGAGKTSVIGGLAEWFRENQTLAKVIFLIGCLVAVSFQ